jgi:hypothetical protein
VIDRLTAIRGPGESDVILRLARAESDWPVGDPAPHDKEHKEPRTMMTRPVTDDTLIFFDDDGPFNSKAFRYVNEGTDVLLFARASNRPRVRARDFSLVGVLNRCLN